MKTYRNYIEQDPQPELSIRERIERVLPPDESDIDWRKPARKRYRGHYVPVQLQGHLPCGCKPETEITTEAWSSLDVQSIDTVAPAPVRLWAKGHITHQGKCGGAVIDTPKP